MKIKKFELFLEEINSKDIDDMDNILKNSEEQRKKIISKKDMIEKGLLNNIRELEPDNQKDVKVQVNDYKDQIKEFDKTVKQIGQLNKKLKDSNIKSDKRPSMLNSRDKNKF